MLQQDKGVAAHTLYLGSRVGKSFPDSDRKAVMDAVSLAFSSFTVTDAEGCFRGRSVATLVIKIATDDQTAVEVLARQLGVQLEQQSVGVETGGYFRSLPMG